MHKKAFREAITDTLIANAINIPMNFLFISLCFAWEFTALQSTLFLSAAFTVLAIVRKTFVRVWFAKRETV